MISSCRKLAACVGGVSVADWKWVIRPEEIVDGILKAERTSLGCIFTGDYRLFNYKRLCVFGD